MKKFLSLVLVIVILSVSLVSMDITAFATSITQSQAVSWANSKVGGSWDYDGVYGAQCVDLTKYYYAYLGVSPVSGNGCDYATNSLPSGWQRIRYYSGFVPQPGDIAVWTYTTSAYGHVAIITSATSSTMYVVEQNGSTHVTRSHSYSYSYGTFYGVIRPNFSSGSSYNYQTITPGYYYVRSNGQSTYNYLTVSGTSANSGAGVNAWSFMAISRVQIANNGGNFYTMKFPDITTANAVNVHTSSTYPTSTTKVTNYKYSGSSTQSWGFDKVSGGYVIRCKANPNMVLTCNGSGQATISAYSAGNTNQIWTLVPYVSGTVSYNANGGSGAPSSQTKYFNQALTLSSAKPVRTGYTFKGWGTSSSDTSPDYYAGSSYNSESGITLYAIWERSQSTYTIKYNANGGSGAPSSQTKQNGTTVTLSSKVPVRFGYTFTGWSTTSTCDSINYYPGSSFSKNQNTTLYACWDEAVVLSPTWGKKTYTGNPPFDGKAYYMKLTPTYNKKLRFESTGSIDTQFFIYDASGKLLASDDNSGTNNNYKLEYTFTKGSTYYLKALAKTKGTFKYILTGIYYIAYDANGGTGAPSTQYRIFDESVYLSTAKPTRPGYTFVKWSTKADGTGTQYMPGDLISKNANIKLYACWTKNREPVPATPELISVTNTTSGVKVIWDAAEGAENYIVYRKAYNATTKKWGNWSRLESDETGTSYHDKTAKSGTYYRYTVRAENGTGLSGYHSSGLKTYFLSTPKLSSIANATGKVSVKWNKASGATGYIVYRRTYNATTKKWGGWSRLATTKSNSYNDTKAKSGVYYRYTVRAYYGDYVSYFDTNGLQTKFLATPTLKTATSNKAGVKVTWGKVSGAKGYNVYRKTYNSKTKSWSGWSRIGKGVTAVSFTDTKVKSGIYYRYTVKAVSNSYVSAHSTYGVKIKSKYTVPKKTIEYLRNGHVWYDEYGMGYYFAPDNRVYTADIFSGVSLGYQSTTYRIDSKGRVIINDFGTGENRDVYVTYKNGKLIAQDYSHYNDMFITETYELKQYTPKITSSNVEEMMLPLLEVYESCVCGRMGYTGYVDYDSYEYINGEPYARIYVPDYHLKTNLEFYMSKSLVDLFYNEDQIIADTDSSCYIYAGELFSEGSWSYDDITLVSSSNGVYEIEVTIDSYIECIFIVELVDGQLKITDVIYYT
ncbi:MAG: InlB B-repeat-containing protein [Clostridia bacterium]|nr:InlB B-repeat-containing protein [Clostridia bacterium]